VQIQVLISPFHIGINILQYSSERFWKYGVPVIVVPSMEVSVSTRMFLIKINQQTPPVWPFWDKNDLYQKLKLLPFLSQQDKG
jgi:hypothetical protein